jgi:hypothetical protein
MLRVLFPSDGSVSQYAIGILSALNETGHQAAIWNRQGKGALDAFYEFRPDVLFLDNVRYLDRAIIKGVTKYNTKLVVVLDPYDSSELDAFPAMLEQVKDNVITVTRATHIDALKRWGKWLERAIHIPYGLDVVNYNVGKARESLLCDVCYIGGFEESAAKHVLPLTYPIGEHSIKIFGNKIWPAPQYLGYINAEDVKNLYSSATTSLYIPANDHTAHEKLYQIVGCGGVAIVPNGLYVPPYLIKMITYYDNINTAISYFKSAKHRKEAVEENLELVKAHTYHERIKTLIENI